MAKHTSGWFKQSVRHSNARKYGKAGGQYAICKIQTLPQKNKTWYWKNVVEPKEQKTLKELHEILIDPKIPNDMRTRLLKTLETGIIDVDYVLDKKRKMGKVNLVVDDKYYKQWFNPKTNKVVQIEYVDGRWDVIELESPEGEEVNVEHYQHKYQAEDRANELARKMGKAEDVWVGERGTLETTRENQLQIISKVAKEEKLNPQQIALLDHLLTTRFKGEAYEPYIAEWARRIKTGEPEKYADDKTKKSIENFWSARRKMGKKQYNVKTRVGNAKYLISYHDGKKKNQDGSDFWDIRLFKNKKDLQKFENELGSKGYSYGSPIYN